MLCCRFVADSSMKWDLFVSDGGGFTRQYAHNIGNVLRLVKSEFDFIFGPNIVNSHRELAVIYDPGYPTTYRSHNLIFLSSTQAYYLQHIYQFSHELCHFMVPADVCPTFRWFEETLCETMSWFILRRLLDKQESAPVFELKTLYAVMPEYIKNCMESRNEIGGIPLSAYVKQHLDYLRTNCYDRAMNRTIAFELLPLLESAPQIWSIIPHLHKLTDDMDLVCALQILISSADIQAPSSSELIRLLCS